MSAETLFVEELAVPLRTRPISPAQAFAMAEQFLEDVPVRNVESPSVRQLDIVVDNTAILGVAGTVKERRRYNDPSPFTLTHVDFILEPLEEKKTTAVLSLSERKLRRGAIADDFCQDILRHFKAVQIHLRNR